SASQEMKVMSKDFGAHHRLSRSGLVQASNTSRAGASNVLVITSSRSDCRFTSVRFFARLASPGSTIGLLPLFEILDHEVQFIEPRRPELAVALDPHRFVLKPPGSEP